MIIKTNAQGPDRKRLAQAISRAIVKPVKYCGAPTFSYEVGAIIVSKDGSITLPEASDTSIVIADLLDALRHENFSLDLVEETAPSGLSIYMPRDILSDSAINNLYSIVEAKGKLIRKSLCIR